MLPALLALACTSEPADSAAQPGDTADSAAPEACGEVDATGMNGDTWTASGLIPASGINAFASADGNFPVFVSSHATGVWRQDAPDASWTRLILSITHTVADLGLSVDDPDLVYRSAGGALDVSYDQGDHWASRTLGQPAPDTMITAVYAIAVAPWDASTVMVVMSDGQTKVSTDEGETFEDGAKLPNLMMDMGGDPQNTHAWRLLAPSSDHGRAVFTDGMALWTSDDFGESWDPRFSAPVGGHSLQRDPADPTHLVIGGNDGLAESFDEGNTWVTGGAGPSLQLVAYDPTGAFLAAASSDTLYTSEDGGTTYSSQPFDWLNASALFVDAEARILLAWDEGIVATTDRGATWAAADDGVYDPGVAVVSPHPTCDATLFAGSRCSGGLFRSVDGGASWHHIDHYFHYVMNVFYDPFDETHVWAVSDDSLLESTDGGKTFDETLTQFHFHGFAIDPTNPDHLLLGSVSTGGLGDDQARVYVSWDAGATWEDSSNGLPAEDVSLHTISFWPGNPDVVLAGTYKGGDASHQSGSGVGMFRSADGGSTWSAVDLAATDIAWITEVPDGLVAATEDGLWRSVDEGLSWVEVTGGPEGILLGADFVGDIGLVLARDGNIWRTDDGGGTWFRHDTPMQWNGTSWLAQVAISASASVAWVTVFDNGVWRIEL
ncbi:hypothetical protein LBMAG42_33740 [Deltaproteobacteria bacterium]|nr:hypothetical protein LBMAG42_33740 [Deltaproteobacteria bacterium]